MISTLAKPRKRLTRGEALEQARAQIQAEKVFPKPKQIADEERPGPRDREQWMTLQKHLAGYVGEQAVVSQGYIWTHRVDRRGAWTDDNGVKHSPVRAVCLGPAEALDPNYKPGQRPDGIGTLAGMGRSIQKKGPGQRTAEGDKTPGFVLGSEARGSSDHLSENKGVLAPPGGRPRKDGHDDLILQLAAEGKGTKAIARTLNRDGIEISYRTVARRLSENRV